MKNISKLLKRTAAAVLCAVGLVSLTGCEKDYSKMMNEAPAEYITMAAGNSFRAMSPVADSSELLKKAAKDGSVTVGFEADGITFGSEAAVSSKDNAASALFTMTSPGGVNAKIYAYADMKGAKIGTIGQSGSHIYDITYEGMAEKLASSIFAPDSGTAYAMSQSDYESLMMYIEQMTKAVGGGNGDDELDDELDKIFTDYFETHKPQIVEKSKEDIGGETVLSNVITYNIPTEDIKSLAAEVFEYILTDGELIERLPEYYDEETMRSSFDDLMDMLEECGITSAYYINAKTNVLMKSELSINIRVDEQPVTVYVNSFLGADPANTPVQSLKAGADISGTKASFDMTKTGTDSGWTLAASADIAGEQLDIFTAAFDRDGKNYSASFEASQSSGSVKIDGTISQGKTAVKMTVDKIAYTDSEGTVTEMEPEAAVKVKKGGEVSVLEAEKELFDLTEEEMDELAEFLDDDFSAVIEEADGSGAMGSYVRKSKEAQANANAKAVHTSCTAKIVQEYVDGRELSGVISGSGTDFTIGGEKVDLSDFLGNDFTGYSYGYANEDASVKWILWSNDPIPDDCKKQLTKKEQDKLAGEKIFIGCYPVS